MTAMLFRVFLDFSFILSTAHKGTSRQPDRRFPFALHLYRGCLAAV